MYWEEVRREVGKAAQERARPVPSRRAVCFLALTEQHNARLAAGVG